MSAARRTFALTCGWRAIDDGSSDEGQGVGLRSRAHTVGSDLKPAELSRRVSSLIWQVRQPVDPAFQVLAFSEEPAAQIWRPIAVRTFFEGPEERRT
jgi:hypothetical protein